MRGRGKEEERKMPKNKTQGIIFGIIMSYAMAYGMEVYNMAIKEGVNLAAGGFSNMTNLIFWEALKEAAYMGVIVFLFSNLWGNRLGAAFAARHCDPQKDNPYICRLLRQAGDCGCYVSDHESCGVHPVQCHPGRGAGVAASCDLGGNIYKELPNGVLLEHVRGGAVHTLGQWKAV